MGKQKLPDKEFQWTPELAYAVGLLATDGSLSKDGRHISLRSCDLDQIEAFRMCLGVHNKISSPFWPTQYGQRICYRITIGGVQSYRWLLKIGLSPAKTYTIGTLTIPDLYLRDFLRGHLDGDGSITTYTDNYNTFKNPDYIYTRLTVRFLSASKIHIEWIRNSITRLVNLKGDFSSKPPRNHGGAVMWNLKFMKHESIKLLEWLYYDPHIPCLERKRKKAEQALAIIKTIKRKPYTFQTM